MHTYLLALGLLVILACLASAGAFMLRRRSEDDETGTPLSEDAARRRRSRMARALAWRVAVSVVLFVCVLLSWKLGHLQPHGVPLGMR